MSGFFFLFLINNYWGKKNKKFHLFFSFVGHFYFIHKFTYIYVILTGFYYRNETEKKKERKRENNQKTKNTNQIFHLSHSLFSLLFVFQLWFFFGTINHIVIIFMYIIITLYHETKTKKSKEKKKFKNKQFTFLYLFLIFLIFLMFLIFISK